jgi:hypothetical protein
LRKTVTSTAVPRACFNSSRVAILWGSSSVRRVSEEGEGPHNVIVPTAPDSPNRNYNKSARPLPSPLDQRKYPDVSPVGPLQSSATDAGKKADYDRQTVNSEFTLVSGKQVAQPNSADQRTGAGATPSS